MKKLTVISFLLCSLFVLKGQKITTTGRTASAIPGPPPSSVRTMAEWEEVQALIITWTTAPETLTEIVRHAVHECKVLIVTDNPISVINHLQNENIPLDNIDLLNQAFNSVWVRDYGPWTVYGNDIESNQMIDWIYNRPERVADDTIPRSISAYFELDHYEAIQSPLDWIHAGGNHLTDGTGTAFSSSLVLDENPSKSVSTLDSIAKVYLGIDQYHKLQKLPFDGIHHLDMHMRFLDEETLLIGQYPEGVADGPQIEKNIQQILSTLTAPSGQPYQIIRIPMPEDQFGNFPDEESFAPCRNALREYGCLRTYTNSLFINNMILVPIYDHPLDELALSIYEEQLPGYNVVGINCNEIIPRVGALHCITKLVGSDDPLWIAHSRFRDTYHNSANYPVTATIKHKTGINRAQLYYRLVGQIDYQIVEMQLINDSEDLWLANIPGQAEGSSIQYFIEAESNSEKIQRRPMVAPEGYFEFEIKANHTAPEADFFVFQDEACADQTIQFTSQITGIANQYNWSFPGGTPASSTLPNPQVSYTTVGSYNASLTVSNAYGSTTLSKDAVVEILAEASPPFFEGFEGTLDRWKISNPTFDKTWQSSPAGNCTGKTIRMDNYTQTSWGTSDYLSTRVDLSDLEEVYLTFDIAYALSNAHGNRRETLAVKVKTCDHQTHIVYSKNGQDLATDNNSNTFFIPNACGDWRTETINLSEFAGQSVELIFENMGDAGNFLYLDNIDFISPQIPNQAPSIDLIAPQSGNIPLAILEPISLVANTFDTDGYVDYVAFYVNGDSVGMAESEPFELDYLFPDFGSYTISAKAVDNDGSSTLSANVNIDLQLVDALTFLIDSPFLINTFPTPTKASLLVNISAPQPATLSYGIFDVAGKVIEQGEWNIQEGRQELQLDVNDLASGMYGLAVYHETQLVSRHKIVIW